MTSTEWLASVFVWFAAAFVVGYAVARFIREGQGEVGRCQDCASSVYRCDARPTDRALLPLQCMRHPGRLCRRDDWCDDFTPRGRG